MPRTELPAEGPSANSPLRVVPRRVPSRAECLFYHSMDLPGGPVEGMWDLRADPGAYLGHVPLQGRSVLEIGPASGFLSFHMEREGARVTALEPPMSHLWDVVPLSGFDIAGWRATFQGHIEQVRNSFWHAHSAYGSDVTMIEADPYAIPAEAGQFDIGVLTAVLMHCRRPFDLLESVSRRVGRTIVVSEEHNPALGAGPVSLLLAHPAERQVDTWWQFTPQFFVSALGVLGFTQARVGFHQQRQPAVNGRQVPMFTVVAERP